MNRKWKALAGAVIAASVVAAPFVGVTAASANGPADNTNSTEYWENLYSEHEADCYKDSHGTKTNDGKAVTLPEFNPDWPGDHWEVLIVKGGSVDYGHGPGNVVYEHPEAGTAYFAPLNDGGNQSDVSHWIVCKGTTPDDPDPVLVPIAPTGEAGIETCVDGASVDANGTITLPAFEGGHWQDVAFGTLTDVAPGDYGFTLVVHEGYAYEGPSMLFVTVPASVDVECDPLPEATPVNPTGQAGIESCAFGVSVDANGTITLAPFEGGHWEGDGGVEYSGTLTDVAPGEYGFIPVIDEGYTYDGPEMFFVTVPESVDVECENLPKDWTEESVWEVIKEGSCENRIDVEQMTRAEYTYSWNEDGTETVETIVVTEPERVVYWDAQRVAEECPVVTPAPASGPTTGGLAATGGDVSPLLPTAAVLASVLGALLIAFGVKRRRQSA